jgi:hypothetical protein
MFCDSARLLAKSPAFAITVIVIVALGVGAATAIFSVVYGVMLRPLPFYEPERLVAFGCGADRRRTCTRAPRMPQSFATLPGCSRT